ncbi:hypothetical protein ACVBEQ_27365 [Nakamurella sp. GG22]
MVLQGGGRLVVFARLADNAIAHMWQVTRNGTWSGWESLGGSATTGPAACLNDPGGLYVVVRGDDNTLYENWQNHVDGIWVGWRQLSAEPVTSDPSVVLQGGGRLVVFARLADNAIAHMWQVTRNGTWSGWESLGGSATTGPAASLHEPGGMYVAMRGEDGALWRRWQNKVDGPWQPPGESDVKPQRSLTEVDDECAFGVETLFVRGQGNSIFAIRREKIGKVGGRAWGDWRSLGGAAATAPAISVNRRRATNAVFVGGVSGNLQYIEQADYRTATWGEWISLGGTLDLTAPPAVIPLPLHEEDPGVQRVALGRFADGRIHYRFQQKNGTWLDWKPLGQLKTVGRMAVVYRSDTVDPSYPSYVFALGSDNAYWFTSQRFQYDDAGKQWLDPDAWAPWESLQGHWTSSPIAGRNPKQSGPRVLLLGRGQDGQIYGNEGDDSLPNWQGWVPFGGAGSGELSARTFGPPFSGSLGEIYSRGLDGGLWILDGKNTGFIPNFEWSDVWVPYGGILSGPPNSLPFGIYNGSGIQARTIATWIVARHPDGQLHQLRKVATSQYGLITWDDWQPLVTGSGVDAQLDWGHLGRDIGRINTNNQKTDDTNMIRYSVEHAVVPPEIVEVVLDSVTPKWKKWAKVDDGHGGRYTLETNGPVTVAVGSIFEYQLLAASVELWKAKTYGEMFVMAFLPLSPLIGGDRVTIRWEED